MSQLEQKSMFFGVWAWKKVQVRLSTLKNSIKLLYLFVGGIHTWTKIKDGHQKLVVKERWYDQLTFFSVSHSLSFFSFLLLFGCLCPNDF